MNASKQLALPPARASTVLLALAAGFLLGVAFGGLFVFSWTHIFAGVLFVVVGFLVGSHTRHRTLLVALLVTGVLMGALRVWYSAGPVETGTLLFDGTRQFLAGKASEAIGGEERAIFVAMVFGYEEDLSREIKDVFNRTGTRHILAISGLNITIVSVLIFESLITVGLWRRQAFWIALCAVLLFVLLVGAPPSAARAGIMAALYLFSQHIGKLVRPWRLLFLAALVMVLIDPSMLFDLGFQLSFAAVLGLIFFKPLFDELFSFVHWSSLRDLISVSLAAQIATWPLIAHTFGTISVVGIVANLFAVPLMSLVMALGMAFLFFGWWHVLLAKVVLWPVWVILHWVYRALEFLSGFSFALVEIGKVHILLLVVYYALLVMAYLRLQKKYAAALP